MIDEAGVAEVCGLEALFDKTITPKVTTIITTAAKLITNGLFAKLSFVSSICERCPIDNKIEECCGSHPETGASKQLRIRKTRQIIEVCPELQTDGRCGDYLRRPDACKAQAYEKLYAQGLGAS